MVKFALLTVLAGALAACASQPDSIQTASVSTVGYDKYNCTQLSQEAERVSGRTLTLYNKLQKTAENDQAQMAVGMILFWPALFFLEGGDGAEAAEYSRLKGERVAIEKVSVQKTCGIKFPPLEPKKKESAGT
ncbi:MAG: hypothetical protein ACKVKG_08795 [Alphaproteobacteria bacterium]|jgi:hypothetical protein